MVMFIIIPIQNENVIVLSSTKGTKTHSKLYSLPVADSRLTKAVPLQLYTSHSSPKHLKLD